MAGIKISIIVATFNSESTLPQVLASIDRQKFPKKSIETLVVDGGSTDRTKQIARKFGARIINNPKTQQNYAKFLGFTRSHGRYLLFLDSDEMLVDPTSLRRKIDFFSKHHEIKVAIPSGYLTGPKNSIVANFVNEFGDPFSFFIYRLSKSSDRFIRTMRGRYPVRLENDNFLVVEIKNASQIPILELTAGGSMFDSIYFRQNFPTAIRGPELLNHAFYLINSLSPLLAITKDDPIIHHPSGSLKNYLNKLSWRIKNNIYFKDTMGISGYSGREEYQIGLTNRLKKFMFIPYCLTILFPVVDSISLSVSRKDVKYLLHFPLSEYTAMLIIFHLVAKSFGIMPSLNTYGSNQLIAKP